METRLNQKSNKNRSSILNLFVLVATVIIIEAFTSCYYDRNTDLKKNEDESSNANKIVIKRIKMPINYIIPLDKLLDSLNINSSDLHILVDKSDFILSVIEDTLIIKQYPVVLGRNPVDDKLCEGDCCTPEGSYKVLAKYGHEIWSRFIWIDYPNKESLRKYHEAKMMGIIPPESTPGGEIGIHGVPVNADYAVDLGENWTAGCISLKNKDVIEIFQYVDVGTEVIIRK